MPRDLRWYMRRLGKMTGPEVIRRGRDAAIKQAWRLRLIRPAQPASAPSSVDPARFLLPRPDDLALNVGAAARRGVLDEAERILRGEVEVLGHPSALLGRRPDWFTDVRTGRSAPRDAYSFDIPYRDAAVVGQIKYVWEPSRHHHLTVLAAAYYLSHDEVFALHAAAHLRSWWDENRFLRGIHWTSGIEIGIRLISWVWIRCLLARWPGAAELFENRRQFRRQLFDHQAYLATLPSHGSSANNHLLAELAGLFVSASAFPFFPQSRQWQCQAAARLAAAIDAQTFADGLNRELATAYHGLAMELALVAAAEDNPDAPLLPPRVWARIAGMADALASIVDMRGRPPAQGDDDGGFALVTDGSGFDRWQSLLSTGRATVGACAWWPEPHGMADLRAALLATRCGRHPVRPRPARPIRHFAEGGMALLRDIYADDDEIWCRVDHGPIGFLATAAHGHADALSIEVRHGGTDILCEPGTYCYHGDDLWRHYFRSTVAHNTLELASCDQAEGGGLFLWIDHPQATLVRLTGLDDGGVAEWIAHHHGYAARRKAGVHRRHVRLDRRSRTLDIVDSVIGGDPQCRARLAYHLGPEVDCRLQAATAILCWPTPVGRRRGTLHLADTMQWTLRRGERQPIIGWYSPRFGIRQPTFTLLGEGVVGSGPWHTHLAFSCEPSTRREARDDAPGELHEA